MLKLNLGCSDAAVAGFINVDRWTPPWATPENFQQADLESAWPWADSSVDCIRAFDILEHLRDKIHTMNEIHRVLKPGGTVEIVVPTTDGRGAFQDPTHVSYWNRNSFFYHEHGNPHLERFKDAYGMRGGFKVVFEREQTLQDGVTKLHIVLEAVKVGALKAESLRPNEAAQTKNSGFAFSIIHTSARPWKWREIYAAWINAAVHPDNVEYTLCVDERWSFDPREMRDAFVRPQDKVIWNTGRRCYVDGVNLAAAASTGDVLIVNADDQYPCDKWDEKLGAYITASPLERKPDGGDFVIEVSTNTPTEHERGIMVMPILSRERYERFGWVFYPEYSGVYADNDFCAMAKRDGVVIDARHLIFPHKHWINQQREMDEQDCAQNAPQAYDEGKRIFAARKQLNFAGVPFSANIRDPQSNNSNENERRKSVAVFTPGNMFGMEFLSAWTDLVLHIAPRYKFNHFACYATGPAFTRNKLTAAIGEMNLNADYVLWIDDDNMVTPEQFDILVTDLETHPEFESVSGWCWCGSDADPAVGTATISCGSLKGIEATPDGKDVKFAHIQQMTPKEMFESPSDLIEIDYSGFPVVLMRADFLFEKMGRHPFNPYVDDRCEAGHSGEDIAFFARAKVRLGARFAVDRRVKVPHFKRRAIEPVPTTEQVQEALKQTAAHMAMK